MNFVGIGILNNVDRNAIHSVEAHWTHKIIHKSRERLHLMIKMSVQHSGEIFIALNLSRPKVRKRLKPRIPCCLFSPSGFECYRKHVNKIKS